MSRPAQDTPAALELRGRRRSRRVSEEFSVLLRGRAGSFLARTVNVSRTGILIELADPAQAAGRDRDAFAEVVRDHFADGVDVHISETGSVAHGELARVDRDDARLLVAFRFGEPLADSLCATLGLSTEE